MHRRVIALGRAVLDEALAVDAALSRSQALLLGVASLVVISIADWVTTYELSLNPLYLLVVIFVTWRAGWRWGLAFALVSIADQVAIGLIGGHAYSRPAYFIIVNCNKLFSALVIVALMARLKVVHEREKGHARIDFLTGALNYKGFYEALRQELARQRRGGKSFSMAYLDCDDFKRVNDNLGHQAGDQLLVGVVALLKRHMRQTDVVARLGGDEFAILLPSTDSANVHAIIDRLHRDLEPSLAAVGHQVTVSIGVATFKGLPASEDQAISFADHLMYQAKARGKNSVIYETLKAA